MPNVLCVCRTGSNGMLTIFAPRGQPDSGVYRCRVSDGVTSQSRDYVVTVQRQSLFIYKTYSDVSTYK